MDISPNQYFHYFNPLCLLSRKIIIKDMIPNMGVPHSPIHPLWTITSTFYRRYLFLNYPLYEGVPTIKKIPNPPPPPFQHLVNSIAVMILIYDLEYIMSYLYQTNFNIKEKNYPFL